MAVSANSVLVLELTSLSPVIPASTMKRFLTGSNINPLKVEPIPLNETFFSALGAFTAVEEEKALNAGLFATLLS